MFRLVNTQKDGLFLYNSNEVKWSDKTNSGFPFLGAKLWNYIDVYWFKNKIYGLDQRDQGFKVIYN